MSFIACEADDRKPSCEVLLIDYLSTIVLHHLEDKRGYDGFDWEQFFGTASIRFDTFEAVYDISYKLWFRRLITKRYLGTYN